MPYVAINMSTNYDEANKTCYATQEEVDTRARQILSQFPGAQVLEEYTAKVSITAKEPAEPAPVDEANTAA